jgi:hypothetical protein
MIKVEERYLRYSDTEIKRTTNIFHSNTASISGQIFAKFREIPQNFVALYFAKFCIFFTLFITLMASNFLKIHA